MYFIIQIHLSIVKKYSFDRETIAWMDSLTYLTFKGLNDKVQHIYEDLHEVMDNNLRNKLRGQKETLKKVHDDVTSLYEQGSHMLNYQLFNVQKNFIRSKEAMEERTMGYLAMGFAEFAVQVDFMCLRCVLSK